MHSDCTFLDPHKVSDIVACSIPIISKIHAYKVHKKAIAFVQIAILDGTSFYFGALTFTIAEGSLLRPLIFVTHE